LLSGFCVGEVAEDPSRVRSRERSKFVSGDVTEVTDFEDEGEVGSVSPDRLESTRSRKGGRHG
jgi:uncharacterized protein YqfB (UPF0267 family)